MAKKKTRRPRRRPAADRGPILHAAEDVLPGHPDRLADALAEALVDAAVAQDPDALVGAEVGVHRNAVFVTGRIAAGDGPALRLDELARTVFEDAGYRGRWRLVEGAFAGPRGAEGTAGGDASRAPAPPVLGLHADLDVGPLRGDERAIRGFSDDQSLVVGYAWGCEATGWLAPAPFVARRLRHALSQLRAAHPDVFGPDGKVLVRIREERGRFAWAFCNVCLHHAPGVGYEAQHALVLPAFEAEIAALDAALPGLAASWSPEALRLNGAGDFTCGGPFGDNGLSGKKLVVDYYGPGVPIGGGALCGKDPHKVDRCGALRARQLAVRLARASGARDVMVRIGFAPGLPGPESVEATVDGETWDGARLSRSITLPDLSIAGTFHALELAGVRWRDVLVRGYFGNAWSWER
jgi:S-adenosylmethionine synthetase